MANLDEQWTKVRKILEEKIPSGSYNAWVLPLVPSELCDGKITLLTPHGFTAMTLKTSYGDVIAKALSEVFGENLNFEILQDEKLLEAYEKEQKKSKKSDRTQTENQFKESKYDGLKQMLSDCHLNTKYKFENFIVGGANKFAYGVSKGIAEGKSLGNPLFIYGGSGLGKTHLLHAIGNYLFKYKKNVSVLYVSAEALVTELINVIRNKSNEENNKFREKYRSCDVLMVDDVQFLIGKEATQEAFFHIFNDLYQDNKQIILTSDRAPKDLTTLSDRLRTRFGCGLTVDIQVPDTETRVAILKNKAAQSKFVLKDDVAEFIAEIAPSNIREMEGLLNRVIFFSSLTNSSVCTVDVAKEAIGGFIEEKKDTIDASGIVDAVCKYFKLSSADIISKKKTKNIVEPRMIAIYLITELLPMPLVQIGEMFGGRDHTTIIHARDKISEEIKSNPRIKVTVADIRNMILNR